MEDNYPGWKCSPVGPLRVTKISVLNLCALERGEFLNVTTVLRQEFLYKKSCCSCGRILRTKKIPTFSAHTGLALLRITTSHHTHSPR